MKGRMNTGLGEIVINPDVIALYAGSVAVECFGIVGMYGMDPSMFGTDVTLVLNANHPLVQYVLKNKDGEHVPMFCKQLFDLAMLSNKPLNPEEMTAFINRSNEIMMLLAK